MRKQDGIDYLDTREVAERLGYTRARISQLVKSGLLADTVTGEHRTIWVPLTVVEDYLRNHPSKRRMIPRRRAEKGGA